MPVAGTATDLDVFTEIVSDFDDFLPCNYGNGACEKKATWTIQCPECSSLEPSCVEHDYEMAHHWDPMTVIIFDCGHAHPLIDCPRKPL